MKFKDKMIRIAEAQKKVFEAEKALTEEMGNTMMYLTDLKIEINKILDSEFAKAIQHFNIRTETFENNRGIINVNIEKREHGDLCYRIDIEIPFYKNTESTCYIRAINGSITLSEISLVKDAILRIIYEYEIKE